jgi:tripartite-type tricarboxylate transporter receptor subunit TctC
MHQFAYRAALTGIITILLGAPFGNPLHAQASRTVKIVVASSPGGVNDVLARMLADEIGRAQNVSLVIENRQGAGEVIGTEAAARAPADGNTLLIAANPFIINPQMRKVNYHPLSSFEPICYLVNAPTLIVVNTSSPYRTLADLFETARDKSSTVTMASNGPGSPFHLGFELLKRAAGVDMTFVPYPGNAPAVNALLGAHVTSAFSTYSNVSEHIKAGRLRALAVGTRSRVEMLPEVPTLGESGYRDIEVDAWFGMFAPARTPAAAVSQLIGWFTAALASSEMKSKLDRLGLLPVAVCGSEFGALLARQFEQYGRIIREANIKAE